MKTTFVVPDNEKLKRVVDGLNSLMGELVDVRPVLLLMVDGDLSGVVHGILSASGLQFHVLPEEPEQVEKKVENARHAKESRTGSHPCEFCGEPARPRSKICGKAECLALQREKWFGKKGARSNSRKKNEPSEDSEGSRAAQGPRVYTIENGRRNGEQLSSYELGIELRTGTIEAGTRIRHQARGLFQIGKADGKCKLFHVG